MSYSELVQNREKRKSVLLTEQMNKDLERVSREKNISQNEIITRALSAYLKRFIKSREKEVTQ